MTKSRISLLAVLFLLLPIVSSSHQAVMEEADLLMEDLLVGSAQFWSTQDNLLVRLELADDWLIKSVNTYVGAEPPPVSVEGKPIPSEFTCHQDNLLRNKVHVSCNTDELNCNSWGGDQTRYIAVHTDNVRLNELGEIVQEGFSWVFYEPTAIPFDIGWGWYFYTNVCETGGHKHQQGQ